MNSREQALQKRVQYLEQLAVSLNAEANLAAAIIDHLESVACAFAWDVQRSLDSSPGSAHVAISIRAKVERAAEGE